MSSFAARERGGPRNGDTADTISEGLNPAARGLGVCGCAKEAAGSARMGLSPVFLLVLALAVSGWPAQVAAVSTFTGESFDFMGQPGRYYSLINTPGVQVRLFAACSLLVQPRSKCVVVAVVGGRQLSGSANAVFDEQCPALCRSPPGIRRAWATTPVRTHYDSSRVCHALQGAAASVRSRCTLRLTSNLVCAASLIEAVGAKFGTVDVEVSVGDGDVLIGALGSWAACSLRPSMPGTACNGM